MNEIEAPYNFVPVSDVVLRQWDDDVRNGLPSHDVPYRDGLCGEISLSLIAETPLLIAGGQDRAGSADSATDDPREKVFAKGNNNRPEIPGSSLKGMIRTVVEIAGFSAMKLIEDRRFGLRDLSGPSADSYRRKFQHHGDGDGKSLGGWLRRATVDGTGDDASGWVIDPCRVERYAHDRFDGAFAKAFQKLQGERKLDKKQAPNVYAAWKKAKGDGWAEALKTEGGELVFTGNPSPKKRKEFLFIPTGGAPVSVPDHVWAGFIDVHERQEKPSDTWMWWKRRLRLEPPGERFNDLPQESVDRIPVFYLHDGAEVIALGLAQMFKMSGTVSTREALPEAHRAPSADPDLAERIFGRIDDDGSDSFRGRAAFSAGLLESDDYDEMNKEWCETVASAPKPGFHPAYLRQHSLSPGARRSYVTWADEGARLRGWKRYPVQEKPEGIYKAPPPPKDSSKRSRSLLRPIVPCEGRGPLRFSTTLRFHNLRPFELGALLWALDFGNDAEARHSLGMGKPFGWGRVRFEIGTALIAANCPGDKKPHLDACRAEFIQKITDRVPSWENSSQLRALRAMAKPSEDASLRYMRLEPGKINEFQEARNAGAVLPPPGGVEDWLARPPRGAQAAPAPARPANALFRKGDKVRDIEMGDFGVVAEDQTAPGADVLVDFDGTQDSMPAAGLERR